MQQVSEVWQIRAVTRLSLLLLCIFLPLVAFVLLPPGPFHFHPFHSFNAPKIFLLNVLGILLLGLMFVFDYGRDSSPVERALKLLVLISVFSTLVNQSFGAAAFKSLGAMSAAITVAIVCRRAINSRYRGRLLVCRCLSLVGIVISASVLLEASGLKPPWSIVLRPTSFVGNRNEVAAFLGMLFVLNLFNASSLNRYAILTCSFLSSTAIVLCRTRAVWIALFVSFAIGAALWLRLRRGQRLAFCMNILGALMALTYINIGPIASLRWKETTPYLSSLSRLFEYDSGSGKLRVDHHRVGLAILSDYPATGIGVGQWHQFYARYSEIKGLEQPGSQVAGTPLSDFLRIIIETGVPGLLILVFLLYRISLSMLEGFKQSSPVAVVIPFMMILSSLDVPLWKPATLLLAAVMYAVYCRKIRGTAVKEGNLWFATTAALSLLMMACGMAASIGEMSKLIPDAHRFTWFDSVPGSRKVY